MQAMARSNTTGYQPSAAACAAAGIGLLAALMVALAMPGNPLSVGATVFALADIAIWAGLPAAAYLGAAVGWGRVLRPLYRRASDTLALQVGVGLALLLTLSHFFGVVGLFAGFGGWAIALGLVLVGLALGAHQLVRWRRSRAASSQPANAWWWALAGAPALALLLVASSSPPGWLWASEGHGYDVMSYHLQLPREWMAMGQLAPLQHNVYSYLPSYMEGAFYHMGVVMASGRGDGLLYGDGYGVLMAQWLHAGVAVLAALMVGRMVIAVKRSSLSGDAPAEAASATGATASAAVLAGALVLSVPWVIVTGSSAYNDMGVVLLLAVALMAALDRDLAPFHRGAIVGMVVGAACGIKPTALFFAGVPAGLVLLVCAPSRQWKVLIGAGVIAGLAMLAPWLVRNAVYSGNPVFPFATGLLGLGHWDVEQAARYAAAHRFDGSVLDRLRLLVLIDPSDPAGPRHRGLLHPQWGAFFLIVPAAMLSLFASSRMRKAATLLAVMLAAQLVIWLSVTHIQSRFLLPLVVPGAALFGLAVAEFAPRRRLVAPGAAAIVLVMAALSIALFLREPQFDDRGPNHLLVVGPGVLTGELYRADFERASPQAQIEFLEGAAPGLFARFALPPDSRLYLLGDATPLYFADGVIYATTWDRSLLAAAILEAPDEPRHWGRHLREAGATHVLVNVAELQRLGISGFLDPALTPDNVQSFLQTCTDLIRSWPHTGVALYVIREGGRDGGGQGQ